MGMIFDTHAHYDDPAFDDDREELLETLFSGEVCGIVNQGTNLKTAAESIRLAESYPGMYAAVGIHPECADENSLGELEEIRRMAAHRKVVAIGEIGLDYYYDIPKKLQQELFVRQLELACELSLPVTIHDREAHGDTMTFLRQYRPQGILHCFSGSVEMAREVVGLGMYIGIGGVVTFRNARKSVEVVEALPLERLVLETDCPYLSPVPFRGKRNDSGRIRYTAEAVAAIKGVTAEEVLRITKENAGRVYRIGIAGTGEQTGGAL